MNVNTRKYFLMYFSILLVLTSASCGDNATVPANNNSSSSFTCVIKADGSGDYPTIQAAIDSSSAGDVIGLSNGIYSGSGNRDIDFHGKAVTVKSVSGNPELCIVNCEASSLDKHNGFNFQNNETSSSILDGITIQNGWADSGGAIVIANGSPVINNCILELNVAEHPGNGYGGAIYCYGSPTISNCIIKVSL